MQHLREHGPQSSLEIPRIIRDTSAAVVAVMKPLRTRGDVLIRKVKTRRQRTGVIVYGLPSHTEAQWKEATERATHAGRHTAGAMFYPVRRQDVQVSS